MGRGMTSRNREQYEPVDERDERRCRCRCFYAFLVVLSVIFALAVAGGIGYIAWGLYSLRPETNGETNGDSDASGNGTASVSYSDVSGGDVQYDKIVPYNPNKDKDQSESTVKPSIVAPSATFSATTLGTAARVLETGDSEEEESPIVTDEEIIAISHVLWNKVQPMLMEPGLGFVLNLGGQVNESTKTDQSPDSLFEGVYEDFATWSNTYTTFLRLLDNYNYITKVAEVYTEADQREINGFLDAVVESTTFEALHKFLAEKEIVGETKADMKETLRGLWFELYSRSPKYNISDSSGFEHVFVGEIRKNKVIGFHNWIQFYMQESAGLIDYYGYYSYVPERIVNVRMKWHEKTKRASAILVGTPPEYDLALYTLCMLVRTGEQCTVDIGPTTVHIQSSEVKHIEHIQVASIYIDM